MARAAVVYDAETGEITGHVYVSQDSDLALQSGPLCEVPFDHPALNEPNAWRVSHGIVSPKDGET